MTVDNELVEMLYDGYPKGWLATLDNGYQSAWDSRSARPLRGALLIPRLYSWLAAAYRSDF